MLGLGGGGIPVYEVEKRKVVDQLMSGVCPVLQMPLLRVPVEPRAYFVEAHHTWEQLEDVMWKVNCLGIRLPTNNREVFI